MNMDPIVVTKPTPPILFWPKTEVDEDVISTMSSLTTAEDMAGKEMDKSVAADRGMSVLAAEFHDPIGNLMKSKVLADGKIVKVDGSKPPPEVVANV